MIGARMIARIARPSRTAAVILRQRGPATSLTGCLPLEDVGPHLTHLARRCTTPRGSASSHVGEQLSAEQPRRFIP